MNKNLKYILMVSMGSILAMGGGILALISFVSKRWLLMILGILLFLSVVFYFILYGVKNKTPFIVKK